MVNATYAQVMDGTGSHDFRTKRLGYLHFQAMLLNNKEYTYFVIYFTVDSFYSTALACRGGGGVGTGAVYEHLHPRMLRNTPPSAAPPSGRALVPKEEL